eukprot:CAMPEP_0167763872 /NCGR_PEP_ID=MMETSP0110_2-20121227/13661_1 /TAXON_ID=629695 /ORGANISM="Gymnochlora sp., Strain CCMP2014" /LENGTH=121 /DNA_ID=CAMNT_0007651099 /DNA_START=1 /DNA_END=363 /DNA_ORIENTATION=-
MSYTEYALTFDIQLNKPANNEYLGVLHLGTGSWGQYGRNPGIWVLPNSRRLHVRQASIGKFSEGCDPVREIPYPGYTTVKITMRGNTLRVFYNGIQQCEKRLTGGMLPSKGGNTVWASPNW